MVLEKHLAEIKYQSNHYLIINNGSSESFRELSGLINYLVNYNQLLNITINDLTSSDAQAIKKVNAKQNKLLVFNELFNIKIEALNDESLGDLIKDYSRLIEPDKQSNHLITEYSSSDAVNIPQ
ncbi:MAG: hypothetical protein WC307_01045 [Candidatus Nanoarchaeia archaeon]